MTKKTQICALKNGVDYLGFHFYLTDTGKVIRKLKPQAKKRYQARLRELRHAYGEGRVSSPEIRRTLAGYYGHLKHGHTDKLRKKVMGAFVCSRKG